MLITDSKFTPLLLTLLGLSLPATASDLVKRDELRSGIYPQAGLIASALISKQRELCGLSGLKHSNDLSNIVQSQSLYIRHLNEKSAIESYGSINTHNQSVLKGHEFVSGFNNRSKNLTQT